jgi:thioesterase domain-containing protein
MITIDFVDEQANQSVKTTVRRQQVVRIPEVATYDPLVQLANSQQNALLQAAHAQRLLKAARQGSLAVDVQRLYESPRASLFTLVERYLLRAR